MNRGEHNSTCMRDTPGCICNRCVHDNNECCRNHGSCDCPNTGCPDFKAEDGSLEKYGTRVIEEVALRCEEYEYEFVFTRLYPWLESQEFHIDKATLKNALRKYRLLQKALEDIPHNCSTCAHQHCHLSDEPCKSCCGWRSNNPNWKWRGFGEPT